MKALALQRFPLPRRPDTHRMDKRTLRLRKSASGDLSATTKVANGKR